MKAVCFISLLIALAMPLPSHALGVVADLYIQAAAVAERCTGRPLSARETRDLAALLKEKTGETTSVDDVENYLQLARTELASAVDCDAPTSEVHVHFFNRSILPALRADASLDSEFNATSSRTNRAEGEVISGIHRAKRSGHNLWRNGSRRALRLAGMTSGVGSAKTR